MTDFEASRTIAKMLSSSVYQSAYEDELSDWYGKYVESRPEPQYLGKWIIPEEDESVTDEIYRFVNGSTIRPAKRRRSRYPKYERPMEDVSYGSLFDKPTEPPELEAGDTAQLDSFLGSFTTK